MKTPLRSHYARVALFFTDERTGEQKPTGGYKWVKVRSNAAIPDNHKMFK